jgi:hypothetical protein
VASGSYSGMSSHNRKRAREILQQGARLMLTNIAACHYSQEAGPRWGGITGRK